MWHLEEIVRRNSKAASEEAARIKKAREKPEKKKASIRKVA